MIKDRVNRLFQKGEVQISDYVTGESSRRR